MVSNSASIHSSMAVSMCRDLSGRRGGEGGREGGREESRGMDAGRIEVDSGVVKCGATHDMFASLGPIDLV